jgi:hypothetical protein
MRKLLAVLIFLSVICLGAEWDYTGTSYYIGDQDGGPIEIYKYGDYWYMLGNDHDSVYQYDNTWSYTGTAYYIGGEDGFPGSIYRYGSYWYMLGNDYDRVYQYDSTWSYTGTSYYAGGQDGFPIGMCRNGSYWYILGNDNDRVYQYDNNWSYTGTSFYVGGEEGLPAGISVYDTYFYVVGLITDSVYQYDDTGIYTGTAHYLGDEDGWPTGVYRYGNYWYMLGSDNDRFYKYEGTAIGPGSPTSIRIFDNAMFNAYSSPYVCTLSVVSTDPQSDDIQYEILWDTDFGFSGASAETTGTYTSGDTATETILLGVTPAEAETLFYWKARARDPAGSNAWSDWSVIRSFIMDLDLGDFPYWYQVAENQFDQCAKNNVRVQGNSVILPSTAEIEFQRASGSTGLSHSIDIGTPGNNRLVVVIACDESSGTNLTNVTVDGKNCTRAGMANNTGGTGLHQELWYILESTLGSSAGTVTVTCSGGDAGWATHALVFYGISQSAPYDFEIEEAVAYSTGISVENVSSTDSSVVILSAGNGTGGLTPSWTSPLLARTTGPDPSGADLATASCIEASGVTNKTYVCTWSATFNRGTGIVAVWEPATGISEGTLTSQPVAYGDLITEGSSRSNWDGAKWMKSSANDSIGLQIQYRSGGSWSPVPDVDLPGNSNYFFQMSDSFCSVDLSALVTATYDTLRLAAKFRACAGAPNPSLMMWGLGNTDVVSAVPLSDDKLSFALYLPGSNILVRGSNTEIKYQLPGEEKVKLGVFDLLGREVATLVDVKKPRGIHSISWQGTNNYNESLTCGVYFLRMEAGEFCDIKKLILLR